jgi:hypothetical protein
MFPDASIMAQYLLYTRVSADLAKVVSFRIGDDAWEVGLRGPFFSLAEAQF